MGCDNRGIYVHKGIYAQVSYDKAIRLSLIKTIDVHIKDNIILYNISCANYVSLWKRGEKKENWKLDIVLLT